MGALPPPNNKIRVSARKAGSDGNHSETLRVLRGLCGDDPSGHRQRLDGGPKRPHRQGPVRIGTRMDEPHNVVRIGEDGARFLNQTELPGKTNRLEDHPFFVTQNREGAREKTSHPLGGRW